MFPIVLFTNDPETVENYISDITKKNALNPTYKYEIHPKEKAVIIEQIRDLNSALQIKFPAKRLICIYSFDTATIEAQNAMLKLLEEKTENNQFILVVNDIQKIVPTILSRCKIVDLFIEDSEVDTEILKLIESSLDRRDIDLLGNTHFQPGTREEAVELLRKIIIVLQKKIKVGDLRASELAKKAIEILHKLESNNLNPQLAIDSFVIELIHS